MLPLLLALCCRLPDPEACAPPRWALPLVQRAAVGAELLDPRECRYVLVAPADFPADWRFLRKRAAELRDAPPAHACMRFPDRALVNDLLTFNRAYRQHIEAGLELDPLAAADGYETLTETERLYRVWDLVRDCRCDYYYIWVRRRALRDLREAIGEEAFEAGVLPPCVPVWRFRRID